MIVQLVGGPHDGACYRRPSDPGEAPAPVWFVDAAPFNWRDFLPGGREYGTTYAARPTRIGVYELARDEHGWASRADDGTYRYLWKGEQ